MSNIEWFNNVHPYLLPVVLIGCGVLFACGLQVVIRKLIGHEELKVNNEVAGFKYAVQGVAYAVLLAFVVIVVWDEWRESEEAARAEAKSLFDLYHILRVFPEHDTTRVQKDVIAYTNSVRHDEWESMTDGLPNPKTSRALLALVQSVISIKPDSYQELAIYQRSLDLLRTISDKRRERLENADGNIPGGLWVVLFSGAFVTLGYPSFFGQKKFFPQVLMTAALAVTVTLILYLIVVLNFPYSGQMAIDPYFFDEILVEMGPSP